MEKCHKSAGNFYFCLVFLFSDIHLSNSHHFPGWQVNVSLLDLLQVGDQLGERVPVDHQTFHLSLRISCVCDDVGCPHLKNDFEIFFFFNFFFMKLDLLSAEGFLSEEVALVQVPDELVLRAPALLHCHLLTTLCRECYQFFWHYILMFHIILDLF